MPARRSLRRTPGSSTRSAARSASAMETTAARSGDGPGAWLELSVAADVEAVEAVSEILGRFASGGTTVEPAFELVEEGLGARLDPSRPSIVRAYVPARDAAAGERAAADAAEALGHLQAFDLRTIGELTTRLVHESDWAEAWKAHFPVLRVGRRIVIRPTWLAHEPRADDVVLDLDPGMAFGTGLHPTTRLCLGAMETIADRGGLDRARVLDVGCGSGILAIAAAKLGAGHVLGVDIDPIAIEATDANAATNGLADRIEARTGSLPTGAPAHDIVLANLIAGILVALAEALHDEVRAGGVVVASGIFIDREADVRSAFETVGLRVGPRWSEGDWVALEAVRA